MKRFKVFLCLLPTLLLAGLMLAPEGARGDDTIYDIQRGLFNEGDPVDVDGVLVTGVGFWGFFVQEPEPHPKEEWEWSGIWVFADAAHLGVVKRGDLVNLEGIYQEYFELSEIDISLPGGDFEVVSSGNELPDPVLVAITDVNDQGPYAENYEGVLIRVDSTDVSLFAGPEDDFEEWWLFTDGVGQGDSLHMDHISADPEGDFEYETPPEGSELTFAQGCLNYSYESYKLAPRSCEEDLGGPCRPSLSGAYAVTPGTFGEEGEGGVNVQFTVNVDEITAEDPANYELVSVTPVITAIRDEDNHKKVHLVTGPQTNGAPETIQVSGVKSESGGLTMEGTQEYSFRAGITPIAMIQNVPGPPYTEDASLLLDQVVTIQGRVTAMDGNSYYFLQDGTGPWTGIYSRIAQQGGLAVGDTVEVAGEVREYYGSTQMGFRVGVNHFVNLGQAVLPPAVEDVVASQIRYNSYDVDGNAAEPFENLLLKLSYAVVDSAADSTTVFGEWFLIQDPDTAGTDLDGLIDAPVFYYPCVGDTIDMTGVLRYAFGEYRILPRSDADINVIDSNCGAWTPDDLASDRTRLWLASPKPNPFAPRTTLRFNLPERGRVGLAIYGVDGRLVRTLVRDSTMEAGSYSLVWDGRNSRGERMPSGLYLVRLKTPKERRSEKLMLIR